MEKQSPYAPIRFRGHFWCKYALSAAKEGHISADGRISGDLQNMIDKYLVTAYITEFYDVVKSKSDASHLVNIQAAKIELLRHWVPIAAQYEQCGRQIFDLDDKLVQLLTHTDLGECSLEGLNFPYDTFFVRFGRQEHVKIPFEGEQFEYLDGAFIARTPYDGDGSFRLKIGFTTCKIDGSGVTLPGYFIDILPSEQKLHAAASIEAAITRRLLELADTDDASASEKSFNSYRRAEVNDSATLLRAGSTLLVNALFYLESVREKQPEPEPGRDTPPEQVTKWVQTTPAKRYKQKSVLFASGYTVVRLMGRELVSDTPSQGDKNVVKAHWRRGHWRLQRHGEELSMQRKIWIKPVMVGADHHIDQELSGHIYVTENTNKMH